MSRKDSNDDSNDDSNNDSCNSSVCSNSRTSTCDSVNVEDYWSKYSFDENKKDRILFSVLELIKTDVLVELNISTAKESINIDNCLFSNKLKITRADNFFFDFVGDSNTTANLESSIVNSEIDPKLLKQYMANNKVVKFIDNDLGNIISNRQTITIDKFTFYKDFRNCNLAYTSEKTGTVEYSYFVSDDKQINEYDITRTVQIGTFELS